MWIKFFYTVKVAWFFEFRFRLFMNNISCYNQNIEHDVTDCTFCDWKMNWSVSLAKFLSHIENITVEKTEDVKRIEIDRTDPCLENWSLYNVESVDIRGQSRLGLDFVRPSLGSLKPSPWHQQRQVRSSSSFGIWAFNQIKVCICEK